MQLRRRGGSQPSERVGKTSGSPADGTSLAARAAAVTPAHSNTSGRRARAPRTASEPDTADRTDTGRMTSCRRSGNLRWLYGHVEGEVAKRNRRNRSLRGDHACSPANLRHTLAPQANHQSLHRPPLIPPEEVTNSSGQRRPTMPHPQYMLHPTVILCYFLFGHDGRDVGGTVPVKNRRRGWGGSKRSANRWHRIVRAVGQRIGGCSLWGWAPMDFRPTTGG